jgi:hypothetical protein
MTTEARLTGIRARTAWFAAWPAALFPLLRRLAGEREVERTQSCARARRSSCPAGSSRCGPRTACVDDSHCSRRCLAGEALRTHSRPAVWRLRRWRASAWSASAEPVGERALSPAQPSTYCRSNACWAMSETGLELIEPPGHRPSSVDFDVARVHAPVAHLGDAIVSVGDVASSDTDTIAKPSIWRAPSRHGV